MAASCQKLGRDHSIRLRLWRYHPTSTRRRCQRAHVYRVGISADRPELSGNKQSNSTMARGNHQQSRGAVADGLRSSQCTKTICDMHCRMQKKALFAYRPWIWNKMPEFSRARGSHHRPSFQDVKVNKIAEARTKGQRSQRRTSDWVRHKRRTSYFRGYTSNSRVDFSSGFSSTCAC